MKQESCGALDIDIFYRLCCTGETTYDKKLTQLSFMPNPQLLFQISQIFTR